MLRGKHNVNNLKNACSLLRWPTHITRQEGKKVWKEKEDDKEGEREKDTKMTARWKGKEEKKQRARGERVTSLDLALFTPVSLPYWSKFYSLQLLILGWPLDLL